MKLLYFSPIAVLLLVIVFGFSDANAIPENDCLVLFGRFVTMENQADIFSGNIVIQGNIIAQINKLNATNNFDGLHCDNDPIPMINLDHTKTLVFPGLVDTHNHPKWNVFSLWNVPQQYNDRSWRDNPDYINSIKKPFYNLPEGQFANLIKYVQVKALVGGTTTIQGTPIPKTIAVPKLIHSIENETRGATFNAIDESEIKNADATKIKDSSIKRFFVHLGEGTKPELRDELTHLNNRGLLLQKTIIIHGTAFAWEDFARINNNNATLVWSPLSNLLLYGNTTRIIDAYNSGTTLSLGPDWSPTGSKNLLYELKVAYWWLSSFYPNFENLSYRLVEMVTTNPAQSIHWGDRVGKIALNHSADLLMIKQRLGGDGSSYDAFKTLIISVDKDVLLVIANGTALYGTPKLMDDFRGDNNYELVRCGNNLNMGINITTNTPEIQRWDLLNNTITNTMNPIPPDPIFTSCDNHFFETLQNSNNLDNAIQQANQWHGDNHTVEELVHFLRGIDN